jgi:hypothetical protein
MVEISLPTRFSYLRRLSSRDVRLEITGPIQNFSTKRCGHGNPVPGGWSRGIGGEGEREGEGEGKGEGEEGASVGFVILTP